MGVCDICSAPGMGTLVSAEDMRKAVYKKGFNPFALGLAHDPFGGMMGSPYEGWKSTIVAQDTSDWNICASCMTVLRSYLSGAPAPTGVKSSQVSFNPIVGAIADANAEQKYKKETTPAARPPARVEAPRPAKKNKKWWEFWK